MSQFEKQMLDILCGAKDTNLKFRDVTAILAALNFQCRIKGDHFIFTHPAVEEILNLQPDGNKAKAYQVRQVRNIIIKYRMGGLNHE